MRIPLVILALTVATPALAQEQPRAGKTAATTTREQSLNAEKQRCQIIVQRVTGVPEPELNKKGPGGFSDLPVRFERAVNRTIDGCSIPVIVRYDVERRR